ncbi:MAG: hypothetical protein M2R45_04643 [Verrucomicrobia subdivision 3 bacterium]|nr:hypothetical protein [Limisphaerales bacterium]MCS1417135.1 hypothetical protein [Limisphaerales bacterium]
MSFFRQGAWMMTATTLAGVFMFAVHLFAPQLGAENYSLFLALLGIINFSIILAPGLQTVFAHESAVVADEAGRRQLAGNVVGIIAFFTLVWAGFVGLMFFRGEWVLRQLKMDDSRPLWMTLLVVLPHLWLPVLLGVLQGKQMFGWLGWAVLVNGLGRFLAVGLILAFFGVELHLVMLGMFAGVGIAIFIILAPCWCALSGGLTRMQWHRWFWRALAFSMGPGIVQFMLTADLIVARAKFGVTESGYYATAGLVGRGVVMFIGSIAGVMFPKLVRPSAGDLGRNLVFRTALASLVVILVVVVCGSVACWLIPVFLRFAATAARIPERIGSLLVEKEEKLLWIADLVPYFLVAMGLLALANVFISHLVAKQAFGKIGCLMLIPSVYGLGLVTRGFNTTSMVLWIGAANAVLLIAAYLFSRQVSRAEPKA